MAMFVKPRPLAWCFFLAALTITVGLGTWQVKRLQWKEGLIAAIETAKTQAPLNTLPADAAALEAHNFYPVRLTGTWGAQEFHVSPRFFKGKLGYFVVTPLALADGRTLLVNRGWVPARLKNPETRPESAVRGTATVAGLLRTGNERNYLTPPNNIAANIWFGRDVADMAASARLANPVPAMVDIVGPQDGAQLPVPSDGTIRLRNDHLSYIVTWYGIALGMIVIFMLYHRKQ